MICTISFSGTNMRRKTAANSSEIKTKNTRLRIACISMIL